MTPNISNKSVYIIFIISINIVSVVCYYQPIKNDDVKKEQRYYLYADYLNEKTEYSHKLDYEQFYNSLFNFEHLFSRQFYNQLKMSSNIFNFCKKDDAFIPFKKFKMMYQIVSLGRLVKKFRECTKSDNNSFEIIKICYITPVDNSTDLSVAAGNDLNIIATKLNNLLSLEQKKELHICLDEFTKPIKKILDDLKEIDFKFNKNSLGKHANYLFHMVTDAQDEYFTGNDYDTKSFKYFYRIITEHKENFVENVFMYTDNEKKDCYNYYSTGTIDYFTPMPEIFGGFDNFDDFIKQSEIKVKYILSLEGPLINNKELYKIYLDNPITLKDYNRLRQPIPLSHETLYSLYSLRLQKLGYFPLYEKTWIEEMEKLDPLLYI